MKSFTLVGLLIPSSSQTWKVKTSFNENLRLWIVGVLHFRQNPSGFSYLVEDLYRDVWLGVKEV